jgi:hypothetical protein
MARPSWAARTPRQHLVRFFRKLAFACIMLGDKKGEEEYVRMLNYLLSRRYLVCPSAVQPLDGITRSNTSARCGQCVVPCVTHVRHRFPTCHF